MRARHSITNSRNDFQLKVAAKNSSAFAIDSSRYPFSSNINAVRKSRGLAPLPVGWRERSCPRCKSIELVGALITDSADRFDPDVVCMRCGYQV
jgi:hypothetical protein